MSLDLIAEMGFVLRNNPPRTLDDLLPGKSKLRKLYDAVLQGRVTSDAEAAELIYDRKKAATEKNYLMLKRNLVRKLTELVVVAEETGRYHARVVEEKFEAFRQLTVAEKLLLENVYHNADKILKTVLPRAQELQLWDVQVQAARLMRHLASLKGDPTLAEKANKPLEEGLAAWQLELAVTGVLEQAQSQLKYQCGRNAAGVALLEEARQQADALIAQGQEADAPISSLTLLNQLRLRRLQAWHLHQPDSATFILGEMQQLAAHTPHLMSDALHLELHMAQAQAARDSADYGTAWVQAQEAQALSEYSAFNRYEVEALRWDLLVKRHEYGTAQALCQEVRQTTQFIHLHPTDEAAWYLRTVLSELGARLDPNPKDVPKDPPRRTAAELFSRTQNLMQDKSGYGLLAHQVRLLLLREQQADGLESEAQALRGYAARHLAQGPEPRTVHFIKWLCRAATEQFISLPDTKGWPEPDLQARPELLRCDATEWLPYVWQQSWLMRPA